MFNRKPRQTAQIVTSFSSMVDELNARAGVLFEEIGAFEALKEEELERHEVEMERLELEIAERVEERAVALANAMNIGDLIGVHRPREAFTAPGHAGVGTNAN